MALSNKLLFNKKIIHYFKSYFCTFLSISFEIYKQVLKFCTIRNLFFLSTFILIANNYLLSLNPNSIKYFNAKEVKIKNIFSNHNPYFMNSVERWEETNNTNEQFKSFLEGIKNKFDASENKDHFMELLEKDQNNNNYLSTNKVKELFLKSKNIKKNLIYDLNSQNWFFLRINNEEETRIELYLENEIKRGSIKFIFGPNRFPAEYKLEFFKNDEKIYKTDNFINKFKYYKNNNHIDYKFDSGDSINKIVLIYKSNFPQYGYDNTKEINEIKVYEIETKNFFQICKSIFFEIDKSLAAYFALPLFYAVSILILGFPIYRILKLNSDENLLLYFLFGSILLSFFSIITFYFQNLFYLFIIYFLFSFLYLLRSKEKILNNKNKEYLLISTFFLLTHCVTHYMYAGEISGGGVFYDLIFDNKKSAPMAMPYHPYYLPYDFDYHLPWATTKQLIHNFQPDTENYKILFGSHNPYDRSMFLPFSGTILTKIFGEKYFIFHCFVISIYFFIILGLIKLIEIFLEKKNFFNILVLFIANPFFVWITIATGNRNFAICYLLFAFIYLIIFNKKDYKTSNIIFSSLFFILACYSHIYVMPFALIFLIILFLRKNDTKIWLKSSFIFIFCSMVGLSSYLFFQIFYSDLDLFLLQVFGIKSERALAIYNPDSYMMGKDSIIQIKDILLTKYYHLKSLFFSNPHPNISIPHSYKIYNLQGIISYSFIIFLIFGLKKIFEKNKIELSSLLIAPLLYIVILNVFYTAGIWITVPLLTYLLIIISIIYFFEFLNDYKKIGVIFLLGYFYEILSFYYHSNKFEHIPSLIYIFKNIPSLFFLILFILIICTVSLSIYIFNIKNKILN